MRYPNRPTIYLSPVRYRSIRYWNWGLIALTILPTAFAVFIIWCVSKAVR